MTKGLDRTWRVLRTTKNEVANRVLVPVLDSPFAEIADGALRTLLRRRSGSAHRELLDRWENLSEKWKEVIRDHPGAMSRVLRDAVLGSEARRFQAACDALIWLREYDLVAALITSAEDRANPHAEMAANTLLRLAEELHDELTEPRDGRMRRDPQLVRRHVVTSLEHSVERYGHHDRVEIIQAFLMLTDRENSVLMKILVNPHAKSYLPMIELLSSSQHPGIVGLLLSYLDDSRAPKSTMNAMMSRGDGEFVRRLLDKTGRKLPDVVRHNLHRVQSIRWVSDEPTVLDDMSDAQQYAAIELIMATRVSRLQAFSVIRHVLSHGKTGGRRAAARVLIEFQGAESNTLVMKALNDPDPEVQAAALVQLRRRGIPGAMTRLVSLIDSPHKLVRDAVRKCLTEFSFASYLAAFDTLSDEARRCTGQLAKKIDSLALPLLLTELCAKSRTRRLRGLSITTVLELAPQVEERLLELVEDGDHFVRAAAAKALAGCHSPVARAALRNALADRSVMVQEAAEESLESFVHDASNDVDVTPSVAFQAPPLPPSLTKPNDAGTTGPLDVSEA